MRPTALVTGARRGIGRAIALGLAQAGFDIERGWLVNARWGRPEEVARVVSTLAQGLLPYTVGQAIKVDGGMLINRY